MIDDVDAPVDADDLEIEITLQAVPVAAARLLIVGAVCRRAFLELDPATASASDDPEGDRFDLAAWLTDEGLESAILPAERSLLNRRLGHLPADLAQEASWQIEAAGALAWALEFLDEPPPYDQPLHAADLLRVLPSPWDKTRPFRENAELLPEELIATERERAELWYWRATVEDSRGSAKGREVAELNAAVKEVAAEAAAAEFIGDPVDNDFPVNGRAYKTLDSQSLDTLATIATERLRALNWLCGLSRAWDAPVMI